MLTSVLDSISGIASSTFEPFLFVLDPHKRLYWGYLLTSVLAAVLVTAWQRGSVKTLLRSLLSPSLWLHRSCLQDLAWLVFNHWLWLFLIMPLLGASLSLSIEINRFLMQTFGPGNFWKLNPVSITMLYTTVLFFAEDFSRFLLHYLYHKVPFLWRFHAIHHSAEILTPFTLYRIHWLELSLNSLRSFLVIGVFTALFMYVFDNRLSIYDVLGVSIFNFLFNIAGANLRHSPIWIGFGSLENIIISPAQHQIHHSSAREHWDKNFGACLSIWDRLFGCFLLSQNQKVNTYGVAGQQNKNYSFAKSFWGIRVENDYTVRPATDIKDLAETCNDRHSIR